MPQSLTSRLVGLVLGMACLNTPADAADSQPDSPPVRMVLRADWSNPTNSRWDGTISLSQGRIESARLLESRTAQARVLPRENESQVRFQCEGPSPWCGLELVVEAPLQASLELAVDGHRLETSLRNLVQGPAARMEWEGWARLRRDPADVLRVKLNRPHVIFQPGEQVELDLEFKFITLEPQTVDTHLQVGLRTVRDCDWLFSAQDQFQVPTDAAKSIVRTVKLRVPNADGAYDLVVRAEPQGMLPVERVVQFVVLNPNPSTTPQAAELDRRLVEEIDPSLPSESGPWYSTRRLKARTTRLGQFLWTSVRHPFTPADRAKDSPVIVCRLNVGGESPGRPHLVNIDYEDSGNRLLAASVVEQDPEGRWYQLPIASGVRTSEKPTGSSTLSHQLIFWPQTKSASLSLYVEGPSGSATAKRIRHFELPQGLPALDVQEPDGSRRLFGLYLDNPEVWAGWGSARSIDPATGLPLDDWRTFLDSMNHLAEYARFVGYNCIQTPVAGQGGALYPSSVLDANYRLDSGSLADSAPDPLRKDVVELLLRICHRNRLSVVPTFRFDGALAALDSKLVGQDAQTCGILLVSREGKVWEDQSGSNTQPLRRYNPLSSDVQAAMLEVVREFIGKYATHPAFEGLAVDLASGSHLVLPSLDWGYDDQTIERFQRDTGLELPASQPGDPARFAQRHQLLTTAAREQWLSWRSRQLAAFLESVLSELQRARPGSRLIVDLTTLAGTRTDDLRDASRLARTAEELLRARGVDLRNWPIHRDMVLLRPFAALDSSSESWGLNSSRELDELMVNQPSRGTLCLHDPELLHFATPSGTAEKPQEDSTETISLPVTRPGRLNLRRYAQSLAGADCQVIFEGGAAIPMGNEHVQRDFARVFRSLPASRFQSLETLQPVVVRSYRDQTDSYVYLVSDASYPVETSLYFTCPAQAVLTNGSTGDKLSAQPTEHGSVIKLTLQPFETVSLRLAGSNASLAQCHVVVPPAAEKGLKVRWDRLRQAMDVMGRDAARTLDGLPPNGDFEEAADGADTPANWSATDETTQCSLDRKATHGGSGALRLSGKAGSTVASDPFTPSDSRALAMNVWLRADRPGQRVRWFLIGNNNEETVYRSYADLPLSTNWEQKQIRARDLPAGQLSDVQIKFQLLDEGTIWIDEARVCALPISQDEKVAISKSVSAIFEAWKERRLSDFERLYDGYWATYLIESVERTKGQ